MFVIKIDKLYIYIIKNIRILDISSYILFVINCWLNNVFLILKLVLEMWILLLKFLGYDLMCLKSFIEFMLFIIGRNVIEYVRNGFWLFLFGCIKFIFVMW